MSLYVKGVLLTALGVVILSPDALLIRMGGADVATTMAVRGGLACLMLIVLTAVRGTAVRIGRWEAVLGALYGLSGVLFVVAVFHANVASVLVTIAATPLAACSDCRVADDLAAQILIARDYQEAITYSFVDAATNAAISGTPSEFVLSNPISSELGVMRASLWPGLIKAAAMNLARQQDRVRLFEIGKSFHGSLDSPIEVRRIAGIALGPSLPEQWGAGKVAVDFFDVKADVSAILAQSGPPESVEFVAVAHHALQPGQCAGIRRDGTTLGWIGKLHPRVAGQFDIKPAVYLFELDADKALAAAAPQAGIVSKFPTVRRDLAVLVACDVPVNDLEAAVKAAAPALIKRVVVFDIYTGPGIEAGLKSVALGLILQETSRTLTAQDADAAMLAAAQKLQSDFAAVLRD